MFGCCPPGGRCLSRTDRRSRIETAEVESEIESVLETADEDTAVHALASFVQSALQNTAAGEKELVEYTHVVEPSDYETANE